jgi:nitroreductase
MRIVQANGAIDMNVFEAIQKRRSIRKFKGDSIENEKLTKVLDAARLAPSAGNRQPCHFIVVTNRETRESLKKAWVPDWVGNAPAVIVCCAVSKGVILRIVGRELWKVDGAIAMQNLVLAATELGLGTCWVASFYERRLRKALGIPRGFRVVALTPIGYPDEEKSAVTDRKPLEAMVHYEKW